VTTGRCAARLDAGSMPARAGRGPEHAAQPSSPRRARRPGACAVVL